MFPMSYGTNAFCRPSQQKGTLAAEIVVKARRQVKPHFRRIVEIGGGYLLKYGAAILCGRRPDYRGLITR